MSPFQSFIQDAQTLGAQVGLPPAPHGPLLKQNDWRIIPPFHQLQSDGRARAAISLCLDPRSNELRCIHIERLSNCSNQLLDERVVVSVLIPEHLPERTKKVLNVSAVLLGETDSTLERLADVIESHNDRARSARLAPITITTHHGKRSLPNVIAVSDSIFVSFETSHELNAQSFLAWARGMDISRTEVKKWKTLADGTKESILSLNLTMRSKFIATMEHHLRPMRHEGCTIEVFSDQLKQQQPLSGMQVVEIPLQLWDSPHSLSRWVSNVLQLALSERVELILNALEHNPVSNTPSRFLNGERTPRAAAHSIRDDTPAGHVIEDAEVPFRGSSKIPPRTIPEHESEIENSRAKIYRTDDLHEPLIIRIGSGSDAFGVRMVKQAFSPHITRKSTISDAINLLKSPLSKMRMRGLDLLESHGYRPIFFGGRQHSEAVQEVLDFSSKLALCTHGHHQPLPIADWKWAAQELLEGRELITAHRNSIGPKGQPTFDGFDWLCVSLDENGCGNLCFQSVEGLYVQARIYPGLHAPSVVHATTKGICAILARFEQDPFDAMQYAADDAERVCANFGRRNAPLHFSALAKIHHLFRLDRDLYGGMCGASFKHLVTQCHHADGSYTISLHQGAETLELRTDGDGLCGATLTRSGGFLRVPTRKGWEFTSDQIMRRAYFATRSYDIMDSFSHSVTQGTQGVEQLLERLSRSIS